MHEQTDSVSEVFGKYANGTLDLSVCRYANDWQNSVVRNLNISVDNSDFCAVYTDILRQEKLKVDVYNNENDNFEIDEQNRKRFQQSFPNFEFLGSYFDDYEDYIFNQEEVEKLLKECLQAKSIVSDKKAELLLRKIIYACNQALKESLCLAFVCD